MYSIVGIFFLKVSRFQWLWFIYIFIELMKTSGRNSYSIMSVLNNDNKGAGCPA